MMNPGLILAMVIGAVVFGGIAYAFVWIWRIRKAVISFAEGFREWCAALSKAVRADNAEIHSRLENMESVLPSTKDEYVHACVAAVSGAFLSRDLRMDALEQMINKFPSRYDVRGENGKFCKKEGKK